MTPKGEIRYKMDGGVDSTFKRLKNEVWVPHPKRFRVGDFVVPFRQEAMIWSDHNLLILRNIWQST